MVRQTSTPSAPRNGAGDYSYAHVHRRTLIEDMNFAADAPGPGDPLPQFEARTTEGERFSTADFRGKKPLLVITGSLTCPMTASSDPYVKELHRKFGDKIEFVMLHVREAHPGEKTDQPGSMEEKVRHAVELKARDDLPFTVAVDDPSGSIHRQLDEKPNAAWLADRDGTLVYRSLWAGDAAALGDALQAVAHGQLPKQSESTRRLLPMAMGLGVMQEMFRSAGSRSRHDMLKAAPPMAVMAWIADKFRPLSPKWRGLAAMGVMATAATAGIAATVRTVQSRT